MTSRCSRANQPRRAATIKCRGSTCEFTTRRRGRSFQTLRLVHRSRTVVAVSQDSHFAELLDALLGETDGYDVVIVESIARGYSRIKEVAPNAIIVFVEVDDPAVCQLLSMLTADRGTSNIPIVTWTKRPSLLQPPSQRRLAATAA